MCKESKYSSEAHSQSERPRQARELSVAIWDVQRKEWVKDQGLSYWSSTHWSFLFLLSPSTRLTFMDGYVVCSLEEREREREILQSTLSKSQSLKGEIISTVQGETAQHQTQWRDDNPKPQEIRGDKVRSGGEWEKRRGQRRSGGEETRVEGLREE